MGLHDGIGVLIRRRRGTSTLSLKAWREGSHLQAGNRAHQTDSLDLDMGLFSLQNCEM